MHRHGFFFPAGVDVNSRSDSTENLDKISLLAGWSLISKSCKLAATAATAPTAK